MMMYHPIKFGSKKISSSADMVETVIFDDNSPNCDIDLENSKPIFSCDTLARDAVSYEVWLQKGSAVEKISPRWTFIGILNLCCDLDLEHDKI